MSEKDVKRGLTSLIQGNVHQNHKEIYHHLSVRIAFKKMQDNRCL